jgi:hypothetical protein
MQTGCWGDIIQVWYVPIGGASVLKKQLVWLMAAVALAVISIAPSKAIAGWGWWGGPGISVTIGPRYYRPYRYGYYGYRYRPYVYPYASYGIDIGLTATMDIDRDPTTDTAAITGTGDIWPGVSIVVGGKALRQDRSFLRTHASPLPAPELPLERMKCT